MKRHHIYWLLWAIALLFALSLSGQAVSIKLSPEPARAAGACEPEPERFGLCRFEVSFNNADGTPATQAGSHPYSLDLYLELNRHEEEGKTFVDGGDLRDLIAEQARGFVGSATAVETCPTVDFFTITNSQPACPDGSAVGLTAAAIVDPDHYLAASVYNLVPPPGFPARLGFVIEETPIVFDVRVKPEPDYNVTGGPLNTPQPLTVFSGALRLWGEPLSSVHFEERGKCGTSSLSTEAGIVIDGRLNVVPSHLDCSLEEAHDIPFLTLPRACGRLTTSYTATSWAIPAEHDSGSTPTGPFEGCGALKFDPHIDSRATTEDAESSSGLDFEIDFEDPIDHTDGLIEPHKLAQSDIKKTVVALPEGVTVNPSIAEGLGVCTPADLGRETLATEPGEGCPDASKIGTVRVDTPLVGEPVEGSVFLAQQDDPATAQPGAENPFDSLIAFYIVLRNPDLGILVKVPAKVEPDPATGQLVTTVDDIPQFPFSRFRFHFREGQRAPLITPATCGDFTTRVDFTPWARPGEVVTRSASFHIGKGIAGGGCPPGGVPPFHPNFEAGSLNNSAAAYSPFVMRLTRADGEQDITKFSATLPPGVTAKLAGVGRCGDAALALAAGKSGRAELASPSCPQASEVGHVLSAAGVGSQLTYVPGHLYLAGPYKGDPLSVAAIVPAVAGPFDAGTVVVRVGLTVDPVTGEAKTDGAASDPIPHILKGIPLKVREIRVLADRPDFTLNPTSCTPASTRATLFGSFLNLLSPADDVPVDLRSHFQAADCVRLAFKPRLSLRLRGGTRRGAFPKLRLVYRPRSGQANLRRLLLRFPHSEFIEQGHFRTICTRVQFAAGAGHGSQCPAGSVYGHARVYTPLLDGPAEGPIYLRSSNHNLPDVVLALEGPKGVRVHVEVSARIDSVHGGLRAITEDTPDLPVTRAIVDMKGGQKGLFVNSTDLCRAQHRANAPLLGQNGRRESLRPLLIPSACPHPRR